MKLAFAIALLLATPALADPVTDAKLALAQERAKSQGQPKYVPITIDQQSFDQLNAYLGDQPLKFSGPIAAWLAKAEEAAAKGALNAK